ncbi:MAG: CAP domain-containing protein, partial [Deltaproteobacteria bacterium]|nr:CAP domain-containing protein [Deltaproteobacteria bacterium]
AVARAHCEDMRGGGFVGHRSPGSGSPGDRIKRAGIVALVVRENVARAYSVEEALDQLAASPAHLENLTSSDVTHLGVGVVVDRRGTLPALLITQNFTRPAQPFRLETAKGDVWRMVRAARKGAGLAALYRRAKLDTLASRYLSAHRLQGRKAADAWLSSALRALGSRYSQVGGVMLQAQALEVIGQAKDWKRASARDVGMALEQREGLIILFALLATPR